VFRDIQGIRITCKLVPELVEKNLEDIHQMLIYAIEKPSSVEIRFFNILKYRFFSRNSMMK
jgi:hypothetical protein